MHSNCVPYILQQHKISFVMIMTESAGERNNPTGQRLAWRLQLTSVDQGFTKTLALYAAWLASPSLWIALGVSIIAVLLTRDVRSLQHAPLPENASIRLIDTISKLIILIEELNKLPASHGKPDVYCDIEGENLSRHGSVSILTIYVLPTDTVYLVDICELRSAAFTTEAADGVTLKAILENPKISKVFFDVRNDSDALHSHYDVSLAGIHDLQLMELGSRWGGCEARKYVRGLAKAIVRDSSLSPEVKARCAQVKESGNRLFAPAKGGSYKVFDQRPLRQEIVDYCAVDVKVLPSLWDKYDATLRRPEKKDWRKRVAKATLERVRESQSQDYEPVGEHKVLGPWHT